MRDLHLFAAWKKGATTSKGLCFMGDPEFEFLAADAVVKVLIFLNSQITPVSGKLVSQVKVT